MAANFNLDGSFAVHGIRHNDQFYLAYFDKPGRIVGADHTGRWGWARGFRVNTRIHFDMPRNVPDRCVHVLEALLNAGQSARRAHRAQQAQNQGDQ